jgi:lysyl-tRNA synthetase class 2
MFQALVERTIERPTFVVDYPGGALAARQAEAREPGATERFELFAPGRELANAFSELNDPNRPSAALRGAGRGLKAARRSTRRASRRGLPARAGVRHAADGRAWGSASTGSSCT